MSGIRPRASLGYTGGGSVVDTSSPFAYAGAGGTPTGRRASSMYLAQSPVPREPMTSEQSIVIRQLRQQRQQQQQQERQRQRPRYYQPLSQQQDEYGLASPASTAGVRRNSQMQMALVRDSDDGSRSLRQPRTTPAESVLAIVRQGSLGGPDAGRRVASAVAQGPPANTARRNSFYNLPDIASLSGSVPAAGDAAPLPDHVRTMRRPSSGPAAQALTSPRRGPTTLTAAAMWPSSPAAPATSVAAGVGPNDLAHHLTHNERVPPHLLHQYTYMVSPAYERFVEQLCAEAMDAIERHAATPAPGLPLIVFDVDDTLVRSPKYAQQQYAAQLMAVGKRMPPNHLPPLGPVVELYKWARKRGIRTAIITGRPETTEPVTVANLQWLGINGWDHAFFRPTNYNGSAKPYKGGARSLLAAAGYRIVGNVGDQQSDLDGPHSGIAVKLPNPLYQIT